MINIRGNSVVIVDSDALIGLIHEDDKLHERCLKVSEYLTQNSFATVVAYPSVLEASTTLSRKAKRPDLAGKLLRDHTSIGNFSNYDHNVGKLVVELYDPKTSNKNTPFDHYVLALAKKNNIKIIFSFDSFYKKNGLMLIEELIQK